MIAGRVYTIAPDRPFVDALAAGLMARWGGGGDPSALAAGLVLLPTRRACRALREAFLRLLEGRPLLLPRMVPLGDIDEDQLMLETLGAGVGAGVGAGAAPGVAEVPPAIPELRRRLLLARLIGTWRQRTGASGAGLAADQAARLAAELARLLDQVQTERLGFEGLADLVPEEYARHWQLTLAFLTILTAEWPAVLAEEGAIDPAARRNRLLEAQAEAWSATAPPFPVVAAGSTGSIPATAALLRVVAGLADGCVVLPGLDRTLDEDSWQVLGPTHPQFGMARLLAQLGVGRDAVADWPAPPGTGAPGTARAGAARGARVTLVREVMRPAETTDAWADVAGLDGAALAGVSRIDCANDDEGGRRRRADHARRARGARPEGGADHAGPGTGAARRRGASALAHHGRRFRRRAPGRHPVGGLPAADGGAGDGGAGGAAGGAEAPAGRRRRGGRWVSRASAAA